MKKRECEQRPVLEQHGERIRRAVGVILLAAARGASIAFAGIISTQAIAMAPNTAASANTATQPNL
ncbi:hypothetical protein ABIB99_002566 [Bradyrhizobium sp. LA6.1]|uniref:hypothetical protein n=1 Tax=Bradyrhizobium sp. LA6.1 TaxID=3156378 RepID=UPI0033916D8E